MGFTFEWQHDDQRVMVYRADGDWNWNDYHTCVRASLFSMHQHPHPVESLIDLRGSTRQTMPSGLQAHVRTFGKKLTPALSGRAVVIGLPPAAEAQLPLDNNRTLFTNDGLVVFVDDEAQLQAILQTWHNA